MKSHGEKEAEAFERFVATQDNILECFTVSGEWDYMLRIVAADIRDYEAFLREPYLLHPAVATASSQFALSRIKYSTAVPVQSACRPFRGRSASSRTWIASWVRGEG
ncbi:Lrp/AsnC ligand binding domain-containing protein [Pseudomonas sp. PDM20]|uniref:Lrp/AsnC ligand binding domain-containing protein n=1 Tax=Pseudomonas sp. PDM20 TaxID=2769254 RepID=UPI00177B71ED|nr:Lrp/AsnC ligand binding domain-containing protein [Pseudomonas sp. PDM20]